MKKIVILAEKPSVARVIAAVLSANENHSNEGYIEGENHIVTWAFGHLIAYAQPHEYGFKSYERDSLPMLPQPNFKFVVRQVKDEAGKYKDDPGAVKQLKVLKRLFDEASSLICATDAGREGEAIFRFIYHFLNCTKPFQRLWISSLTDKAIREGMADLKPGSNFDNLYAAAETRSKSDWLIGMNASQALTIAAKRQGVYSLGRVQTPTLGMLCQRYQDNKDFVPKKYWQIRLKSEKYGVEFFMSSLQKFDNRQQAEELMNAIRQEGKIKVVKTETKEVVNEPPLLHDLTSLQREANNKYGFSADKTLTIAQLLYEHRLITYPRTGSRFIPDDVFEQIPVLLDNLQQYPTFAGAALNLKNKPLNRKSVNPAKVTDHHALLITETHLPPFQNEDEKRIFDLVAGRMLEAISDKCIKEVVTDTLSCKDVEFILQVTTIRSAGWKAIFNEPEEKEENDVLPIMHEDESLDILATEIAEKQTKPQPIHTDASLLAAMEQAGKSLEDVEQRAIMKGIGIGTPATRAAIIETLNSRGYIKRDKKNLIPTEKGLAIYSIVKNMKIANVQMTAEWEAELAKIEQGEIDARQFMEKIEIYTTEVTQELLSAKLELTDNLPTCICPKCKENKILFYPRVAKCSNPDCGLIVFRNKGDKIINDKQLIELFDRLQTGVIKGFKRKDGGSFDAALKFDEKYNVVYAFPPKEKSKANFTPKDKIKKR